MIVSVAGSAALALALGLRHGLDADHLAAIDGLTRFNTLRRREFAPYCGALFSAGHGGAIVLAAALLTGFSSAWTPPTWLEWTGKFISAATLLYLGALNLRRRQVALTGLRSNLLGVVLRSSRAWQIVLVGALFAMSFDALALAVLFAANATAFGGCAMATALGLAFTIGMVIVDTSNGVWMAHLARRSDQVSETAARAMSLIVALISVLVGTAVAYSCLRPSFDHWLELHELFVSLTVLVGVACGYLLVRSVFLPREARAVRSK